MARSGASIAAHVSAVGSPDRSAVASAASVVVPVLLPGAVATSCFGLVRRPLTQGGREGRRVWLERHAVDIPLLKP